MNKSFKQRVEEFWEVFGQREKELRMAMDAKEDAQKLVGLAHEMLDIAFDEPYFEMGFSTEQGKYELIMSPEGDRVKLPLLYYWKQKAPASLSDRWNFYATRPALAKEQDFALSMFNIQVKNEDVFIYYEIDDNQKFNLEVYCQAINTLKDEGQQYSIFFILLDQFLGEAYTMQYVGTIDFIDKKKDGKTITPRGLKDLIDETIKNEEWEVFDNPMDVYSGYSMEPDADEEDILLRTDIYAGYSSCFPILDAYYGQEDEIFDNIAGNGAVYGFLFYNNTEIDTDDLINVRAAVEDEILEAYKDAYSIGGATGEYFSYIDFVVFDLDSFLKLAKEVTAKYELEAGFKYFKQTGEVIDFN